MHVRSCQQRPSKTSGRQSAGRSRTRSCGLLKVARPQSKTRLRRKQRHRQARDRQVRGRAVCLTRPPGMAARATPRRCYNKENAESVSRHNIFRPRPFTRAPSVETRMSASNAMALAEWSASAARIPRVCKSICCDCKRTVPGVRSRTEILKISTSAWV
jgi:hypothetical protein